VRGFILIRYTITVEYIDLVGDRFKADNDQNIAYLHEHEVYPLIKHRGFSTFHKAWNARLDAVRRDYIAFVR